MSTRRRVIFSAFVDGSVPAYINVRGLGPINKIGPGRYDLPITSVDYIDNQVIPSHAVISLDGLPAVLTLLPITPGVVSVLITHLDGTPVDAIFGMSAIHSD